MEQIITKILADRYVINKGLISEIHIYLEIVDHWSHWSMDEDPPSIQEITNMLERLYSQGKLRKEGHGITYHWGLNTEYAHELGIHNSI